MSTINVSNIAGPSSTGTAATLSSINSGPLAGFRNAITNGNFDIWQRGTSFTASGITADRWRSGGIGSTFTTTRQPFTVGQTAVPGEPPYFCRTVVSSVAGSGNYLALVQAIEGVRTFAGQQVTLSFWAKVDATKNIAVEFGQFFGSGGSPSSTVFSIGVTKVSIGTSWQKVTVTATMPSISGKTIGTDNNDVLSVVIWFDAGSDFNSRTNSLGQQSGTFEIAQVQLERGPVATPFEQRPQQVELALCQRYFSKSYAQAVTPGTVTSQGECRMVGAGASFFTNFDFPVEMRALPTVISYSPVSGASGFVYIDVFGNSAVSTTYVSTRRLCFTGSGTNGQWFYGHYTASAEL